MRTTWGKVRHAQAMTHMLPRQLPFFSASAGTSSSRSAGRAATTHMLPRQLPLLSNSAGTPVSGLEMGAAAERMVRVEYMAGIWDEGVVLERMAAAGPGLIPGGGTLAFRSDKRET
jgi:hypothetical protein